MHPNDATAAALLPTSTRRPSHAEDDSPLAGVLTPDAQMLVTARSRMHLAVQPAAGMCCHTTTHTTSSSSRSRRVLLRCRASSSEPPAQQPEQERDRKSVV